MPSLIPPEEVRKVERELRVNPETGKKETHVKGDTLWEVIDGSNSVHLAILKELEAQK